MADVDYKQSDVKYIREMILSPDPVVTAVELAEEVGVSQQAAHSKLEDLEERGLVESKAVGSRAVVWWLTVEGRRVYADSES
ncbi:MarR family transcriptional regulator [Halobellus sp. H-GB7]|uniref:MarR family transcriptional regulator n=1 Tax=Halobellus sp. H-GB7 TaxID=3069756 RepID=UPI0027ADF079|nr:MarR family transcriptional regulator [Halobellus sp. H-GB7]MDQ2055961.1 MarR family transcriptional regulator [Halobellus sp. H-GB7]